MKQEMKAIREGYGKALEEIGKDREVVAIDADLSGSTKSAKFHSLYPERFFNMGIAEQNLIGVAAGLAASGKKVFASSFAVFITGRAFDFIRVSLCYANVPVTLFGSHAGMATGEDGASHQALEDIAIMRALPEMTVISPCDFIECREAIKFLKDYDKPAYVRGARPKSMIVNKDNYKFEFGKGITLKKGKDLALIATGLMVAESLEAAKMLEEEGINAMVINIHTIKPIDRKLIMKAAEETKAIITLEDHSIIGGLGSAVAEILAEENSNAKFMRIGIKDKFGESGKPKELYEKYGLNAENVYKKIKKFIK